MAPNQQSAMIREAGRPEDFVSKKLLCFCLLSIAFTLFLLFGTPLPEDNLGEGQPVAPSQQSTDWGRYAITTYLGPNSIGKQEKSDNLDSEFIGTRTLVYQLLHSPSTKLRDPVPVIILVHRDVRESKRQRLRDDGATVIEVESIADDRWGDIPTKLRIFDPTLVPYHKILFMDADIILTRPIDKIFDDPNAVPRAVDDSQVEPEMNPLPQEYILAASPLTRRGSSAVVSTQTPNSFCGGLFMYSPSTEVFQYYTKLLGQSELYHTGAAGDELLNYAHRQGGPMPWKNLRGSWYLNTPGDNDLNGKTPLLHTKLRAQDGEASSSDSAVGKFAQSQRWEMEGYWIGKTGASR